MQVLGVPARTAALMQPIAGLEVPVPGSCNPDPVGSVGSSICHTKQQSGPMTGIGDAGVLEVVKCHAEYLMALSNGGGCETMILRRVKRMDEVWLEK